MITHNREPKDADTDLVDGYLALENKLCSFQAHGMVRLLVSQLISVTGFSVDHRTAQFHWL